ncbi:hypothetical protein AFEL58S_02063 [Afipia felis]
MNKQTTIAAASAAMPLTKADPTSPVFTVTESGDIAVKFGTSFLGRMYHGVEMVRFPETIREPGTDYAIVALDDGRLEIVRHLVKGIPNNALGGFHFAPGGNALARHGGDSVPAINPYSLWDRNFRPACADPRGMAQIEQTYGRRFWCDIYLLGVDHVTNGTSRFGVVIADGSDLPIDPSTAGKTLKRFDYATAVEVMAHHGKGLLSFEEFAAAAYGVMEKSSAEDDPERTGLDAVRTSKFGIMQATGNMWVWGHDGDPDEPRASIFGGGWFRDGLAGSRCAGVACYWPGRSHEYIGARGRSDHLQLG